VKKAVDDVGDESRARAPKNRVDIKPLKKLVFEKFPKDCALRSALLAERDVLETYEFLAKMETFLNLLKVI